jgi:four helix bundle protein
MDLARQVYLLTARFPAEERFGLSSQMRRCSVSVPSNIAEGACRGSKREMLRFLMIARGSLGELDTQLRLLDDIGMPSGKALLVDVERLFSLMGGLARKLRGQSYGSQAA